MTQAFNIRPPNRVDFVYTYACTHGPGGRLNNRTMSLEMFAYATKGIAHELGMAQELVLMALEKVEPQLNTGWPGEEPAVRMPVSSRLLCDLRERAAGEDEYVLEKQTTSPLVQHGVLATYASQLSQRDAEQAAYSMACHKGPVQSPRVSKTPEWGAYSSPDHRKLARRIVWPFEAGQQKRPTASPF